MKREHIATILNFIGILLMIAVILIMIPFCVPKAFGFRIYGVLTGSMTPTYQVGGVIYVSETDPEDIQIGDAVTFSMGTDTESVMTHRVVDITDGYFLTKGDANNAVDAEPVSYDRVIGKVRYYIPKAAKVAEFVNSKMGVCVLFMVFASAFILWIIADMLVPSKKKKHKPCNRRKVVQWLGVALLIGSALNLGIIFYRYHEATKEFADLQERIFGDVSEQEVLSDTDTLDLTEADRKIIAGIIALKEENPDVVGWLVFDNKEISYPIMQGEDNAYYLNHLFSGEENSSGSIFMEASNASDFQDCHTLIYGHNMKNQSMFGSLKKYKTQDYYDENRYFSIYTTETVYRYQIFAYYDISMNGFVYQNKFEADDAFASFIEEILTHSYRNTGICPKNTDKIVTLSTCSTEGNRFVVHGVRMQ